MTSDQPQNASDRASKPGTRNRNTEQFTRAKGLLLLAPPGADPVSAGGLPAGTRGLPDPSAVPECGAAAAGVQLPAAGAQGHLHR